MGLQTAQGSRAGRCLSNRSGKVAWVVVLMVGCAALALATLWWSRATHPPTVAPAAGPDAGPAHVHDVGPLLENPDATRTHSADPDGPPPPAYPSQLRGVERYTGVARLEVYLDVAEGTPTPQNWALSLEPSKVLMGSSYAKSRRIDAPAGANHFVVDDVALGGYQVRVLADGYDGPREQLELHQPSETDVVVHLRVYRQGFLTGRVQDANGSASVDIEVTAQNRLDGTLRTARTDAQGNYTFDVLPDGDYRVFVGLSATPLAAFEDISFVAPSLHMPALVVPNLANLTVRVFDALGLPLVGATVEGRGLKSGVFELVTDADGSAVARHCAEGEVKLYVVGPAGERGNASSRFDPTAPAEITVRIAP